MLDLPLRASAHGPRWGLSLQIPVILRPIDNFWIRLFCSSCTMIVILLFDDEEAAAFVAIFRENKFYSDTCSFSSFV